MLTLNNLLCPQCSKRALSRREYNRKIDNALKRIDICMSKGCGYIKDHTPNVPSIKEVKAMLDINQGQEVFNF